MKPVEGKSLRDSLKLLSDSLSKYQTAAQSAAPAKNIVPLKQLYKKLKSAVFLIYTIDNTDTAQGSGFFVDSSGIAISNYHVFESAGRAVAITDDGNKYPISQILDYSEEKDYVIFRVGGGGTQPFPFVKKSTSETEIGDDCFAVGNPKGLTQTLSTGIISGIRFDGKVIQTTTAITFGSSGGALFNSDGEVIGITSGGMGDGNLNFAININQIPFENFLKLGSNTAQPLPKNIESEIHKKLTGYFKALFNKEYSDAQEYFTDNLYRFYSKFNITSAEAVKSLQEDWEKSQIQSGSIKVHWKTLGIERNLWGFEAKLNADYYLVRAEKTKPSHFNLDLLVEFNKDLLIQSIYENILTKYK